MARDIVGEGNEYIGSAMREFFYVDLQRVRSYYSQINRGIIDSIITKDAQTISGEIKATLFGLGGAGSLNQNQSRDESRSLQELTYVLFEELLEERHLITDLGPLATDPAAWHDGRIHNDLKEGQIVRFTGDITVLDPHFFSGRISQIIELASAVVGLDLGDVPGTSVVPPVRKGGSTTAGQKAKSPEVRREEVKRELVTKMMDGLSSSQLEEFGNFFSAFSHNTISIRAFPCGDIHSELHFSGALLSRSEYMQAEREELYSRYGNRLFNWTIVMQVARIPRVNLETPNFDFDFELMKGSRINRVATESMINGFIEYFEYIGMAEGATFPAISVTPLALYREFS